MKTFVIVVETALIAYITGALVASHMYENDEEMFERAKVKWAAREAAKE